MVAQTRAGGQASPKKLSFNEKIVGKGLSTDSVLKKLKALHTELAELDQDLVDVGSLGTARKELINTSILLHKDRGVKAYAACCLADILRLYAPDAPYTHTELRDIFQFFFRQLVSGLKGADSSYYNEYFHLLESLSTVKSVVLVCDLPNADELMVDIFRDFFSLVRRDLAKKIEMFMADILIALIDECQALPPEVLDTLMSQFMDKHARMDQPAYRLAVQVCNATADKLQRHVCQYFTDIVVAHSRDEEFDEIRTAHELIKQLNRSCPSLLHSVIPQLEEELRVEDVQLRTIATQVLGEMFSDKGGADLVRKYPTTWTVWLMRRNDKSAAIRLRFVEATKGLLVNLPEHRDIIEDSLQSKLLDPDEKVRAAVCRVYAEVDYETALHHVSEKQLRLVAGRGLDKKNLVRYEALNSLGRLYSLAYPEIENGDPAAIAQFSWIPNEILHMVGVTPEVRTIAERVVFEHIFPFPPASTSKNHDVDEAAWADRLLSVMRYLDDKAIKSLLSNLSGVRNKRPTLYDRYVQCCIQNNGGIIDENEEAVHKRLNVIVQHIAGQFSDPQKVAEDLHAFAKLNEGRLYKLLKTCMDTQTDLKGLVKATNEFRKRIEQSSTAIKSTMSVLLRRASLRILNQSSIPTLIKRVQAGNGAKTGNSEQLADHAQTLLDFASKHCPALYKSHIGELGKAIADEKNSRLVGVALQALSAVVRYDDSLAVHDARTMDRIARYALGPNPRHSKFAARLLSFSKNREELCNDTVRIITDALPNASPEVLAAHITVLAQFARLAPDSFEQKSDVIMAFLLKQILMVPCPPDSNDMDDETEWFPDDRVPAVLRCKVLALKVCRNRCLAHASSDTALDIMNPVLKMFLRLLEYSGSFNADAPDDPKVKSRVRLQAAVSLLHLSSIEIYADTIARHFKTLAITVQDPCFEVRLAFFTKLISLITPRKLHPRFNCIPFLTIHDPEPEVKSAAVSYISYALRSLPPPVKVEYLEMIFIRLLHFLAHHPDFALSHEQIPDIAKYVEFYLDQVATAENVSLLYHMAMKLKTVRDSESEAYSQKLYAMSELAQELIKTRAHLHSWSIQSYPGKVKLPPDILRALPNPEAANKIMKTVYLPEETASWLAESSKAAKAAKNEDLKKRRAERPARPSKATGKRKAAPRTNGHAKRARKRRASESDDDDDDESPTDSSDAEAVSDDDEDKDNSSPSSDAGDVEPSAREKNLSRGARTRAKAKIRQQTRKKMGKGKLAAPPPSTDVDD
ncbi:hypothetical protein PLICRDRAFT_105332 [Plicaturopsis crispa FD-325 SS-3]|nr:hypothetical protein PLICRDRAFT_105332 [Plicaturopsis crispa FD-325 SS-3]